MTDWLAFSRDCVRDLEGVLGTGLPVNPVSPEDAVEELLGRVRPTFHDAREAAG